MWVGLAAPADRAFPISQLGFVGEDGAMEWVSHLAPSTAAVEPDVARVRPAWLPVAGLVAGWSAVAGGLAVMLVSGDADSILWFAAAAALLSVAGVICRRRPAHAVGAWFAVTAGLVPVGFLLSDLLGAGLDRGASDASLVGLLLGWHLTNALTTICALRVIVLFPDARYLGRIDRGVLRASWMLVLVPAMVAFFAPQLPLPVFISDDLVANPVAMPGLSVDPGAIEPLLQLQNLMMVIGAGLLVRRYRRVELERRRSIRWLLLPVITGAVVAVLTLLVDLPSVVVGLGTLAVVVALGVAITLGLVRPAGIDVDDALRRSLVYAVLVVAVAALYAGVSAVIGWSVGGGISVGWAIGITVVVMIVLQPVRTTLERAARRWLFGTPPDPRAAVLRLGDRLADTYDVETVLEEIAAVLVEGLDLTWARVRVIDDDRRGLMPAVSVPIRLDGDELGTIECGPKRTGRLDADDVAVLTSLATQAALAVRNARLKALVDERNAELAASRARLVRAQDEERRRIEQNIHDGVQQDLVALIGHAGLLQRRLRRSITALPDDVASEADEIRNGLQRVLDEVRELAAGIHPTLLRDRGLVTAVEGLAARHPIPVTVSAPRELRVGRLPIEIEGAGYYVVAESLANSLKHANATQMTIDIARSNGTLSIRVRDDGDGFEPAPTSGNGLANLSERVAALGGQLQITSRPGHGTTVNAGLDLNHSAS